MSEDYNNDSPVWKIEGEQEWRKGNTQIKLSPKAYKIVFRDIEGYQKPKSQIVYVVANQTVQINANYTYVGDVQSPSSQEEPSGESSGSGEGGESGESSGTESEEDSSSTEWVNPNEDILHFVAEKKDSTISYDVRGEAGTALYSDDEMYYSTDNCETWIRYRTKKTITLENVGDTIYFKNKTNTFNTRDGDRFHSFHMTGKIAAYGSVMSLVDNKSTLKSHTDNAFKCLFKDCSSLTRAPRLPAIELSSNCYASMFQNCTSLEEQPELPATGLANKCYESMFKGCTSLKYVPVLPASVMVNNCYQYMFSGCSSLTMPPSLPSMTLAEYCYSRMFENCTSLVEMPDLPATLMEGYCYDYMFAGCTGLTTVKRLPSEDLHRQSYYRMFFGCTGITEVDLPVTSLSIDSCKEMFKDCTSLRKVTVNFESWLDEDNATFEWLNNVSSEGEFIAPESLAEIRGTSNIPSGWTLTRKTAE